MLHVCNMRMPRVRLLQEQDILWESGLKAVMLAPAWTTLGLRSMASCPVLDGMLLAPEAPCCHVGEADWVPLRPETPTGS